MIASKKAVLNDIDSGLCRVSVLPDGVYLRGVVGINWGLWKFVFISANPNLQNKIPGKIFMRMGVKQFSLKNTLAYYYAEKLWLIRRNIGQYCGAGGLYLEKLTGIINTASF